MVLVEQVGGRALRAGEAWAWWVFLVTGSIGFLSFLAFLAFLGHGYLDTWHGVGTLVLLPMFVAGLVRARRTCRPWLLDDPLGALRTPSGLGWLCLLVGAAGAAVAGLEILRIGTMEIFVPEDLQFMDVGAGHLHATNPRLVPLIAHDRAGFGGAVLTAGLAAFGCLLFTPVQRALWQAMLAAGSASLAAAVGVHFMIGYVDAWHLAPPAAGMAALVAGLALTHPAVRRRRPPLAPSVRTPPPPAG